MAGYCRCRCRCRHAVVADSVGKLAAGPSSAEMHRTQHGQQQRTQHCSLCIPKDASSCRCILHSPLLCHCRLLVLRIGLTPDHHSSVHPMQQVAYTGPLYIGMYGLHRTCNCAYLQLPCAPFFRLSVQQQLLLARYRTANHDEHCCHTYCIQQPASSALPVKPHCKPPGLC